MKSQFNDIITERDIDRLLKEELECNRFFLEWFLGRIGVRHPIQALTVGHSVSDAELGESDLIVLIDTGGEHHAVMIENKIDAPLQPRQGVRYRKRGDRGVANSAWNGYTTCLVAPASYLKETEKGIFDGCLSYEAIAKWFQEYADKDPRMAFRMRVMKNAIEEGKKGYQKIGIPVVTNFWQQYWSLAQKRHRSLNMPWPEKQGWKSTWIDFYPGLLDRGVRLIHKMPHGFVDLQFSGQLAHADSFPGMVQPLLGKGMALQLRGRSFAVSIPVQKVEVRKDFQEQSTAAEQALRAAARLAKWYVKHRQVLRRGIT